MMNKKMIVCLPQCPPMRSLSELPDGIYPLRGDPINMEHGQRKYSRTYLLLKTGELMIVVSDNYVEETYTCYPLDACATHKPELHDCSTVPYDDVAVSDTNLPFLMSLRVGILKDQP